jgi:coatomer subunit zeta
LQRHERWHELILPIAATATNPYPDVKSQKAFEKGLLEKTNKQTGDILLYDGRVVCYKTESDTMVYVVGGADENEVLLYNVLLAVRDSLHLLFKCVDGYVASLCEARN